jgi:hypothetical protein
MPDNPVRGDPMARDEIQAQPFYREHLRIRKRPISPFASGIDDLDADRDGIEIAFALPARSARVKRAPIFRNEAPNSTVFFDDIMGADPCGGIA